MQPTLKPLSPLVSFLLAFAAWIIVAFGDPAAVPFLGVLASIFGYALFFRVMLDVESAKRRFLYTTFWFALVQGIQLGWLLSHPYSYIYGIYLFLILSLGAQLGVIGALLTPRRLSSWLGILGLAGLMTVMEWLRLFFFSGFTFNPIGIALSSTIWGLQNAALVGVYGLSFLVVLTNLVVLRAILYSKKWIPLAVALALFPYLFGYLHLERHRPLIAEAQKDPEKVLSALLVQTAFPIEETMPFSSFKEAVLYVQEEWRQILTELSLHRSEPVDLIALPEYVVPFGTYVSIFPFKDIEKMFEEHFGDEGIKALAHLEEPLALEVEGVWHVSNGYICQSIANLFQADLIAGLQDDQWVSNDEMQTYSAAFYFWPGGKTGLRYEKQVLLPMAEYIPFDFVKEIAKEYGISGSFSKGAEAKVFPGCKAPFGLSICYEETYGDLMRENRVKGAEFLVNLTSDVWYPNSSLPKRHFDHARLRATEMGIPLLRACNTGITSAIDSVGEIIGSFGIESEWERKALFVKVPLYHYKTIYTKYGDNLIITISILCAISLLFSRRSKAS